MASKLTDELRSEIEQNPCQAVPLLDEQTGKIYYVCDESFLFAGIESDSVSKERLLSLLNEGEQSGEVSAEEGKARMQATIDKFKDRNP